MERGKSARTVEGGNHVKKKETGWGGGVEEREREGRKRDERRGGREMTQGKMYRVGERQR